MMVQKYKMFDVMAFMFLVEAHNASGCNLLFYLACANELLLVLSRKTNCAYGVYVNTIIKVLFMCILLLHVCSFMQYDFYSAFCKLIYTCFSYRQLT